MQQIYALLEENTVVLTQIIVALIIITQLKNKTKWYISTISTQMSSQYYVTLQMVSNNEP